MSGPIRTYARGMMVYRLLPFGLALGLLVAGLYFLVGGPDEPLHSSRVLRVLSYSSFVNSWGPGPELAKSFEKITGVKVELQDAGDAGLLLSKMELFPADVVLGFDQFLLEEARQARSWRRIEDQIPKDVSLRWSEPDFLAFDWGPIAFVYREGEVEPPQSLTDLLDSRFKGAIALQDPRTSSPGLQFFFWVIDTMGEEEGFEFLKKLKPNLHSVASSWSSSYGAFSKGEAKLALSYSTSPVYHWKEEGNSAYRPAVFSEGHPIQIEYAGIPYTCENCGGARLFIQYLLQPEVQRIIMKKNYMLPVVESVSQGTEFEKLPELRIRELKSVPGLLNRREELFERWRRLGL